MKAFDPALTVLVFPILGAGVPEMHVAVDYEDVVSVMFVHVSLPRLRAPMVLRHRGAGHSITHGRMNHWPPVPRARCAQPHNGLAAAPQKTACLGGRRSVEPQGYSRGQVRRGAPNSAAGLRPTRSRPFHRLAAGSQAPRPASPPRRP